ncbi:MAG: ABC transporter ATP-binding protein [Paracoccaceae bacterium]
MLQLKGVQSHYGRSKVLHGIDLSIEEGQVATLIGRNGMGKTTTVRAILGLNKASGGEIHYRGRKISGLAPHRVARLGIGLVPEGRQIFPTLSVRENLIATSANRSRKHAHWGLREVFDFFPVLEERQDLSGSSLSGGEQQMLAIGRALMTNPDLLILDEATEGLAPLIRKEIYHCIAGLKAAGESILLIDKNITELTSVADTHTIVEKGVTCWTGSNQDLIDQPELLERYVGV